MKRLFVENFSSTTTQQAILDLFQGKGKVDSVTLHPGRSGDSQGYALVVMENDQDAKSAICALNNTRWNGVRLTVTRANRVASRPSGFSGGSLERKQR